MILSGGGFLLKNKRKVKCPGREIESKWDLGLGLGRRESKDAPFGRVLCMFVVQTAVCALKGSTSLTPFCLLISSPVKTDVSHRSSLCSFLFPPNCCLFFFLPSPSLPLSFSFLYSCVGLTKDGSNENIDSLEEVLNILAEESSDWFYGFLSFLYDVLTPFEILEEEESEAADDVDGTSQNEGVQGKKTCVILDLQNQ